MVHLQAYVSERETAKRDVAHRITERDLGRAVGQLHQPFGPAETADAARSL